MFNFNLEQQFYFCECHFLCMPFFYFVQAIYCVQATLSEPVPLTAKKSQSLSSSYVVTHSSSNVLLSELVPGCCAESHCFDFC